MKTVAAEYRGVDDNFRFSAVAASRDLGRLHADACVSHVLGLPRHVPAFLAEDPDRAPSLTLTGTRGQRLRLARTEPGSTLRLWVSGGEQNVPIPDIQAAYRIRGFIEHWGEETELTAEIRLPPEARAMIADLERMEDETRRRRMRDAPPREVFASRPYLGAAIAVLVSSSLYGLGYAAALIFVDGVPPAAQVAGALLLLAGLLLAPWLFLRRYELVVDREKGEIREHLIGKEHVVAALAEVRQADVKKGRACLALTAGGERPIGREGDPVRRHARIADCVNDAIDLPSAKRKVLLYRRDALHEDRR